MKITLHYGDDVLALPAAVADMLGRTDAETLKVLLCVASNRTVSRERIAKLTALSSTAVDRALAFWQGAGLLDIYEGDHKESKATAKISAPSKVTVADSAEAIAPPTQKAARPFTPPRYSTEELVKLLEDRRELAAMLDECSRILGKVFSTHETSVLLSLIDHLNVDSEYMVILCSHCAKMDKPSIRNVERTALSIYDEGATTPEALTEHLKWREEREELESKIRTLFGMGGRSLTTKERRLLDNWIRNYHYGMDVITLAYEIAVDAIGKSSIPYTNSILERWAAAELHTLPEIQAAEAARKSAASTPSAPGNSFDTDDFFGAALKRSFGDDYRPAGK